MVQVDNWSPPCVDDRLCQATNLRQVRIRCVVATPDVKVTRQSGVCNCWVTEYPEAVAEVMKELESEVKTVELNITYYYMT